LFFFFQAEDGIRDATVTGVQTCALPIYWIIDLGPEGGDAGGEVVCVGTPEEVAKWERSHTGRAIRTGFHHQDTKTPSPQRNHARSEERRVGQESRWRDVAED